MQTLTDIEYLKDFNIDIDVLYKLKQFIQQQAKLLHFEVSIAGLNLDSASQKLRHWLDNNMHGTMAYMEKHAHIRANPQLLLPTAVRAIMVRMNYAYISNPQIKQELSNLNNYENGEQSAVISLYAKGRDYHKVLRKNLAFLAVIIQEYIKKINLPQEFNYRVFTDSAPVMEVELASQSGLGWRGKHSLLVHPKSGSLFFLGGMLTNLPLPIDEAIKNYCGTCSNCMDICPTKAIIAPYTVDARRCISYLTIEHEGAIPLEFRSLIGKHIYGCDECQLVCPWNKFTQKSLIADFEPRNYSQNLLELWSWNEENFLRTMEGTAIRRIGFTKWQRNLATVMGNYLHQNQDPNKNNNQEQIAYIKQIKAALMARLDDLSLNNMVKEHILWALDK